MDEELIYQVAKLIAESDSIGEGYGYCEEYTREDYARDKDEYTKKEPDDSVGYYDLAIKIIQLVQNKGE